MDARALRRHHRQGHAAALSTPRRPGCRYQQPDNNVVRTAIEALSAVLGGTQSLHTNALDEVFALPTERAAAIALRTQQVIAAETGVANVIDPLGGSWYVEHMTDLMEQRAEEIFARIDRFGEVGAGGVLAGIDQGWFQQQMADAAFRYQQQLEKGEKVIVGVNKYVTDDDEPLEILRISAEVEREQRAELARRAARDQGKVDAALDALEAAAGTDDNLIPRLVDAARVEATVGEMAAALKKVWASTPSRRGSDAAADRARVAPGVHHAVDAADAVVHVLVGAVVVEPAAVVVQVLEGEPLGDRG